MKVVHASQRSCVVKGNSEARAKAWRHTTAVARAWGCGVALGATRRQMEEPLSIRRELPGEPPQLTSCKKCLLITKVQIRTALKTAGQESLNRSRALTFRLSRNGGLLSLYAHRLVNLQSGRGNGHAEFSPCCFFLLMYVISFHIILLSHAHSNYTLHTLRY